MSRIFPKWMNVLPTVIALGGAGGLCGAVGGFWYWATPKFFKQGYMPIQPGGGFNHQIHAGKLGMDCRYCHTKIEESAEANIPNVATCYGCHAENRLQAFNLETHKAKTNFIREAYAKDESIPWRRVHKLPDYVRNFPHHIHIDAGVSCFSCHGMITAMPVVFQQHGMGMAWCLDCHRKVQENPDSVIVPKDRVTQLVWVEEHLKAKAAAASPDAEEGRRIYESLKLNAPENCGACHY